VADVSAKPFYAAATSGIVPLHLARKSEVISDKFSPRNDFVKKNLSLPCISLQPINLRPIPRQMTILVSCISLEQLAFDFWNSRDSPP
jgi:hypothetical protein